jgi:hypothetical protein
MIDVILFFLGYPNGRVRHSRQRSIFASVRFQSILLFYLQHKQHKQAHKTTSIRLTFFQLMGTVDKRH